MAADVRTVLGYGNVVEVTPVLVAVLRDAARSWIALTLEQNGFERWEYGCTVKGVEMKRHFRLWKAADEDPFVTIEAESFDMLLIGTVTEFLEHSSKDAVKKALKDARKGKG